MTVTKNKKAKEPKRKRPYRPPAIEEDADVFERRALETCGGKGFCGPAQIS